MGHAPTGLLLMELYIGNIPASMTEAQLKSFFAGYDKNATFKIIRSRGRQQLYIFGLVSIPSKRQARNAIHRLNNKRIDGKLIVVREYISRALNNNRRNQHWNNLKLISRDRRRNERRTIRLPRISPYVTYAA